MTFFTPEVIANIILHVAFISSFLGIFFFTYGSRVEKDVVKDQIDFIVKNFTDDITNTVPPEYLQRISPIIQTLQPPDMSKEDIEVEEQNHKLLIKAMSVISVVLAISILSVVYLSKKYNFDLWNMIKENIVILCFVALTEFCFLTFIGKTFRSADPNFVKFTIIQTLKKYAEN